eukprot:11672277-Alexandrium_andersonii.AAC.1
MVQSSDSIPAPKSPGLGLDQEGRSKVSEPGSEGVHKDRGAHTVTQHITLTHLSDDLDAKGDNKTSRQFEPRHGTGHSNLPSAIKEEGVHALMQAAGQN